MKVSENQGHLFGGPHNQDHDMWGSILGSTCLWKLLWVAVKELRLDHYDKSIQGIGFGIYGYWNKETNYLL